MSERKSLSNRIKEKEIRKLEKEANDWELSSPSRVLIKWLLVGGLNIISWTIIAFFIYIWWTQMGAPVGCERITPDLCNMCFAREVILP